MSKFPISSLAVVLPRYGASLGGGAEALAKSIVDELMSRGLVQRIEVWTTCAVDHRTWENQLPEGETEVDGVLVRRFAVSERDLEVFIRHEVAMREGVPLSVDEQLDWLENSVNSEGLYAHIREHGEEFDALLFAPYLFATTFWGALIHPDRSIVIPCLHNEHYAYLDVFRYLFDSVRGLIFNAEAEQELALSLYKLSGFNEKSAAVGMGFDENDLPDIDDTVALASADVSEPYILYSGRKEQGKNLDLLIEYYQKFSEREDAPALQLVIIGAGEIQFLEELPSGVIDLGFVSEEEKHLLMRRALALVQPSTNESFSIVMMEAWLQGTPVIVHADCAVTREHVVKSGGGLYFANEGDFTGVLLELLQNPSSRSELASSGKRYVQTVYCWDAVMQRLQEAFAKFRSQEQAEGEAPSGPIM